MTTTKFKINLNPAAKPNVVGEMLRNIFFNEDDGNTGCYSTFQLRTEITPLPQEVIDDEIFTVASYKNDNNQEVIMKYHWDGDGMLLFKFEDGSVLVNDDCKKDYNWKYFSSYDSWLQELEAGIW